MLFRMQLHNLLVLFIPTCVAVTISSQLSDASPPRSSHPAGYWADQLLEGLAIRENAYFNGSSWPSSLQWTSAVLNTLLATSDISFANALAEFDGAIPGSQNAAVQFRQAEKDIFTDVNAFYDGVSTHACVCGATSLTSTRQEDTNQIFDSAYDDVSMAYQVFECSTCTQNLFDKGAMGRSGVARSYQIRPVARQQLEQQAWP
jgi:hypothetical protein